MSMAVGWTAATYINYSSYRLSYVQDERDRKLAASKSPNKKPDFLEPAGWPTDVLQLSAL